MNSNSSRHWDARAFREDIQILAGTLHHDWIKVVVGNVVTFDPDTLTCTVRPTSGEASPDLDFVIGDVQLVAENSDGALWLPAVEHQDSSGNITQLGSTVIVVYPTKSKPFVAQYSNVLGLTLNTQQQDSSGNITGGAQVLVGETLVNGQKTTGDISLIGANGTDQVLVGQSTQAGSGVQLMDGSQPAVLGNKNKTALTDIYDILVELQTFVTGLNVGTLSAQAAALTSALGTALPQLNSDIAATISQKVTLE